ncbi:hypothetical protein [Paraglaciecola hydrolytica]|uniref:hypothetical protein n=1 Tax=Paraglaciecola hydrolytica TaxID=1799789 RepID=UPI000AEF531D|nr:hypothetical protein [Paraglaciecola hydrolytica]
MSKAYINYYSEISHLPVDEQEKILEKARYEAFVNLKLSGRSACYLFGCLSLFFLPVALSISFFGFFSIPTLLLFVISVTGPTLLNRYLQGKLIHNGLNSVLSGSDV